MTRRLGAYLAAALLAVSPAGAEQVSDLGTKAPVTNGKTWRELLRAVFPDLRHEPGKDGKPGDFIHGKVDLRPIGKAAFNDDCEVEALRIDYIEAVQAEISKKMRLIVGVTTEYDSCFGALVLFDPDGKLLDAANIQQDANYAFGGDFVRPLGPDGQLVVADSFHTTTSTSPDDDVLVLATADRLSLIGNVDAKSEWDCDHHRGVDEQPSVAVTPDYGPFDRITGYIKRTIQPVADDCRTPAGKPAVTITRTDWRWDAARKTYRKVAP